MGMWYTTMVLVTLGLYGEGVCNSRDVTSKIKVKLRDNEAMIMFL